jgi:hypothetical protein
MLNKPEKNLTPSKETDEADTWFRKELERLRRWSKQLVKMAGVKKAPRRKATSKAEQHATQAGAYE